MARETPHNPRSQALVRDVAGLFEPGTLPQPVSQHNRRQHKLLCIIDLVCFCLTLLRESGEGEGWS